MLAVFSSCTTDQQLTNRLTHKTIFMQNFYRFCALAPAYISLLLYVSTDDFGAASPKTKLSTLAFLTINDLFVN